MVAKYYECGCCGEYHRVDFTGDCRDDSARFTWTQLERMEGKTIDELIDSGVVEDEDEE